jgi:NADP-dependent 3-hydroxy acid dehydrogenase YdfG
LGAFYGISPNTRSNIAPGRQPLEVNRDCTGLFLTCKHALPAMVEAGGGTVIGISSIEGVRYTG